MTEQPTYEPGSLDRRIELARLHIRRALRVVESPGAVMTLFGQGPARACLEDLDHATRLLDGVDAHVLLRVVQVMRDFLILFDEPSTTNTNCLAWLMPAIRRLLQLGEVLARSAERADALFGEGLGPEVMADEVERLTVILEHDDEHGRADEVVLRVILEGLVVMAVSLAFTPLGDPARPGRLRLLSDLYIHMYLRIDEPVVYEEAVWCTRCQVAEAADGHPGRLQALEALAHELHCQFHYTHQLDLLDEALNLACEAMAAASPGTKDWIAPALTAADVMSTMFVCTGDLSLRDDRRRWLRVAADEARYGDAARLLALGELASALYGQAETEGDVELADEAVDCIREAVASAPSAQHDASYLLKLGEALNVRYELTLDVSDIHEAIAVLREALAHKPAWGESRISCLQRLSAALHARYKRVGRHEDLEEAVRLVRMAVAESPPDHTTYPDSLLCLAYRLHDLSNATGDLDALSESILSARKAVDHASPQHTVRVVYLHFLGGLLRERFARTDDRDDLEEAVSIFREAVAGISGDEMLRTQCLGNLGMALAQLYGLTQNAATLAEARAWLEVSVDSAAPAWLLITCNRALAMVAAESGDGATALSSIERALELTEIRAQDSLDGTDRAHRLSESDTLSGEAAAVALSVDRPDRAVELLERARSVLAADILDLQAGELERLRNHAPALAGKFEQTRAQLDQPYFARRAQQDIEEFTESIRQVPGFAEFRRPPRIDRLAEVARKGPVVLLASSTAGSAALILTDGVGTDRVRVVPLPDLDVETARQQAERLWRAGRAAHRDLFPAGRLDRSAGHRDHDTRDVLEWLWNAVTEPVLSHLDLIRAPRAGEPQPRLWWCPSSVLSYLPFHAAGRRGEPAVLDYVVSSYTTTVRALARPAKEHRAGIPKTLIVPVPDIPGSPLPGVDTETAALLRLIPDATTLVRPIRAEVLASLPRHRIAHFACHGYGDRSDPAFSRLILTDHAEAPLTLSDISGLNLDADLAYLSACDTGIAPTRFTDQSLHFTGAFQLAGYRHVIGTLWSVHDQVAAELATDFYDRLTDGGTMPPRTELSARALHDATQALRARYAEIPALWAAHTHTGS